MENYAIVWGLFIVQIFVVAFLLYKGLTVKDKK